MSQGTGEVIRSFIADRFLFDAHASIDPASSLIQSGVLDSTGVMELVMFLEDTFRIRIADAELVPQNLDTLRDITAMVERKLGRPGAAVPAAERAAS